MATYRVTHFAVVTAGSGYAVDDVISVVGGTNTVVARAVVTSVYDAGLVADVAFLDGGNYTVKPANSVSTTGGLGSSLELDLTWEEFSEEDESSSSSYSSGSSSSTSSLGYSSQSSSSSYSTPSSSSKSSSSTAVSLTSSSSLSTPSSYSSSSVRSYTSSSSSSSQSEPISSSSSSLGPSSQSSTSQSSSSSSSTAASYTSSSYSSGSSTSLSVTSLTSSSSMAVGNSSSSTEVSVTTSSSVSSASSQSTSSTAAGVTSSSSSSPSTGLAESASSESSSSTALSLTTSSASSSSVLNLIVNPSFEVNTASWNAQGTNTIARSTVQSIHGVASLKVTYSNALALFYQTMVNLSVDTTYEFSCYVWIPADWDGGTLSIYDQGDYGGSTFPTYYNADLGLRDQWQLVRMVMTTQLDVTGRIFLQAASAPTAGKFVYADQWQCLLLSSGDSSSSSSTAAGVSSSSSSTQASQSSQSLSSSSTAVSLTSSSSESSSSTVAGVTSSSSQSSSSTEQLPSSSSTSESSETTLSSSSSTAVSYSSSSTAVLDTSSETSISSASTEAEMTSSASSLSSSSSTVALDSSSTEAQETSSSSESSSSTVFGTSSSSSSSSTVQQQTSSSSSYSTSSSSKSSSSTAMLATESSTSLSSSSPDSSTEEPLIVTLPQPSPADRILETTRSYYMPAGAGAAGAYAARKFSCGSKWTVVNIGVRLRQRRVVAGALPGTLGTNRRVGFGVCYGTTNPMGAALPDHFIGVRTAGTWTADGSWWVTGWELVTVTPAGTTTHQTGATGKLRVSDAADFRCSAWYLRFTKQGATMKVDLFIPAGKNEPMPADFARQMKRTVWNTSVNNHGQYTAATVSFAFDEPLRGYLDCMNIFSNIPNFVSSQLRGIEWAEIKAVRLS